MEIFILIMLIVLNGIFAMSEIALVTARRSRLLSRISSGDKKAQAALKLGENPTQFLSTIQIGITSIGLLSGIFGEAALAVPLAEKLQQLFNLPKSSAHLIATIGVVTIITYISIVVGELVPKRLGQINPEGIACLVARPMNLLSVISKPFILLLTSSTSLLLKILKVKDDESQAVTEEEIQAMINESSENGMINIQQKELIHNVFRLDDRPAVSIMIPKRKISFLDLNKSRPENIEFLKNCTCTYLPVCDGEINNIIGLIHAKQALLILMDSKEDSSEILAEHCTEPFYVPEKVTILELLKIFQTRGLYISFVIDEYGVLQGMLTVRNILNVLAGQVGYADEKSWATPQNNCTWILNGSIPILELKDKLQLPSLPDEDKGYYTILSGLLMYLSGNVPKKGDVLEWQDWKFEIMEMDGTKIETIQATKNRCEIQDKLSPDPEII